jgi:heme/copper-type cytochrome/quinol oxidase subunit 1
MIESTGPLATSSMKKLIEKPHHLFFIAIPIILLIGYTSGKELLDYNLHDTYIVISSPHIAILISVPLGIMGSGYWIMSAANRTLSKWLTWAHLGPTFGGMLLILLVSFFVREESKHYEWNDRLSNFILLLSTLIVFGQLFFPLNILYGLLKKKNKTSA